MSGDCYGLTITTTIAGQAYTNIVVDYDITARLKTVRSARVRIDDHTGQLAALAVKGATFAMAFDYGGGPTDVFGGKKPGIIEQVKPVDAFQFDIVAFCPFRAIQTQKLTVTQVKNSPGEMIRHLVAVELDLDASGIDDDPDNGTLDKLPLYNQTAQQACEFVNQRMGLDQDYWVGPDGTFYWQARDFTADPVWEFVVGDDADELDQRHFTFISWGVGVELGDVIGVTDATGTRFTAVVEGLRWYDRGEGQHLAIVYSLPPDATS